MADVYDGEFVDPSAAPVKKKPAPPVLPPGTVADPGSPTGIKIVDRAAYSAWNAGSLAQQAGGTAATAGGLNNATTAGSTAITADLNRRQSVANPFQVDTSGQLGAGTHTAQTVQQQLASAGPVGTGTAGFTNPGAPRVATTQAPARAPGTTDLGGQQVSNPTKVGAAADQSRGALGPAPRVDMGIADRGQSTVQQALGLSQQAVNAALAPVDQTGLQQATADARSVLDALLNGPNTADRIGSQTLRSQLALARSAAGGPGAVQEALRNAQMAAPELEAQAAQAGTAETLQRTQAAGNVAGQLQTAATNQQANETARINAASSAASGFAQGALGSRAQDIDISKANLSAASNLLDNVRQLTGQQLELDQRNQELIGQMARDANATNFNWAQLTTQQQEAEFDRWVKVYGIDQAAAAQIKSAAKAANKNAWDYIIPLVGAGATIAAGALAGPPGAIAAGAATGAATQAAS